MPSHGVGDGRERPFVPPGRAFAISHQADAAWAGQDRLDWIVAAARFDYSVRCLCPHSLQVNSTRDCPMGILTLFGAPHFPHTASTRVSPWVTLTVPFSRASRIRRSASSRIACFDIGPGPFSRVEYGGTH